MLTTLIMIINNLQGLRSGAGAKPVVVLGDLNCAHKEIDVYAPKKFTKNAGFTKVCAVVSRRRGTTGEQW